MSDELLIDVTPLEMRLAVRGNGKLESLHVIKPGQMGHLPGTPVLGRIKSVVPSLEAAFVDIGFDHDAFLPLPREGAERFHEGASVLGQIVHDGFEGKGARLSRDVSIAGRGMVLSIGGRGIRVSRRIEDEAVRDRLKGLGERLEFDKDAIAVIWRTEAAGMEDEVLQTEFQDLLEQATFLIERAAETDPGDALLDDVEALEHFIDDLSPNGSIEIITESASLGGQLDATVVDAGLFERSGVEAEIENLLGGRVELPCGGNIVVERTEAMTTIDINTARMDNRRGGRGDKRARALDVNLEAAVEIARVVRATGIGGLIAIDFLKMREERGEHQVLDALRTATEDDPGSVRLGRFSPLGLVDMSRARRGPSLVDQLTERMSGTELKVEAAAALAVRLAFKEAGNRSGEGVGVEVSSEVFDYLGGLSSDEGSMLEGLKARGVSFSARDDFDRDDVEFGAS
jgi:ribonuclease G